MRFVVADHMSVTDCQQPDVSRMVKLANLNNCWKLVSVWGLLQQWHIV